MRIKTLVTLLQGAAVVAKRPRLGACKGAHDTWVNLWNKPPLSTSPVCVYCWIGGVLTNRVNFLSTTSLLSSNKKRETL